MRRKLYLNQNHIASTACLQKGGRKALSKNMFCILKNVAKIHERVLLIKLHCKDTVIACNLSKTKISVWIYLMLAIKISHNHTTDNFIPRIVNKISRLGEALGQRCSVKKVF